MQDFLVIEGVSKAFGARRVVAEVSVSMGRGEFFSLLGPSGCGKTTLLRLLAGFEAPDAGRIWLNGQDITTLPPERRPVNTVFQNYALFPHLSVGDNIAFGLRIARKSRSEVRAAVERMLALVRLEEHAAKKPSQLSGGQRQRVAIARALINEPQVLLLDEPLAALDLKLRQHMLTELTALHAQVGTTFVYVTHDQGEAISLSQRIAVMNEGRIEQVDTPRQLYTAPVNGFVAGFIGDANFLTGTVQELLPQGHVRVQLAGLGRPLVMTGQPLKSGQEVRVMIRPESLHLRADRPGSHERVNLCQAVVEAVTYFGPHLRVQVRCGETRLSLQVAGPALEVGAVGWLTFAAEEARVVG